MHVGSLIQQKIKVKGIRIYDLAQKIGYSRQYLHAVLRQKDVNTGLIEKICLVTGENIFQDMAEQMQKDIGKNIESEYLLEDLINTMKRIEVLIYELKIKNYGKEENWSRGAS